MSTRPEDLEGLADFLGNITPEEPATPEAQPTGQDPDESKVGDEAPTSAEGVVDAEGQQPPTNQPVELPEFVQQAIEDRNYYGVDLSGLNDEQAEKLVRDLHEKWTKPTNRLQQENAQLRQQTTEQPQTATEQVDNQPPEELSDEDLLRRYGYDPEDPMLEAVRPYILPMVRKQWDTEQYLQLQADQEYLAEVVDNWMGTLDEMEEAYGELPVEREEVLKFALENKISDPEVAYIKFVEPYRRAANEAAREARRAEPETPEKEEPAKPKPAQRVPPVTARPHPGGEGTPPVNLRESVKDSMLKAEEETGLSIESMVADLLADSASGG